MAYRVSRDAGADRTRQIDRLYQLALGRLPTPEENQLAAETLNQLQAEWGKTEADPDREALANLCHVLVNSAEFIYID